LFSDTDNTLPSIIQDTPLSNLPITSHQIQQNITPNIEPDTSPTTIIPITDSDKPKNQPPSSSTQTKPVNNHPMQTRSKNGITLPKLNPKLLLTHTEPKTAKQALADPKWHEAMKAEFEALQKNQT
jgi:hypothetical protein